MTTEMKDGGDTAPRTASGTNIDSQGRAKLRGNMGIVKLVFSVLAFNAPLGAFAGMVPLVIMMGGGLGTPLIFLGYGVLMAIFAVGYVVMSNRIPRAGAFYTFVTAGLGRPLGLGAAILAIVTYTASLLGTLPFGGISVDALVSSYGGPSIPWWATVLVLVGLVAVMGVLQVDFSARVIGVLVVLEVLVVLVYDAFVVAGGGKDSSLSVMSIDPSILLTGGAAVALVFAVGTFAGFESTAIFRDEVKDPRRTIPIATFTVIGLIALFYAIGSWIMILALGTGDAVNLISANPATIFLQSLGEYVGTAAADIANVLVITSLFAAMVSLHNIIARYLFNLGADGILPASVGKPHPRFGSPYIASISLSTLTIGFFILAAVVSMDPLALYAKLIGIAGYGLIALITIAAIGIATYLFRTASPELNIWQKRVAPMFSAAALIVITAIVTANLDYFTGSRGLSIVSILVVAACVLLGCVQALVLRSSRPRSYARIGVE